MQIASRRGKALAFAQRHLDGYGDFLNATVDDLAVAPNVTRDVRPAFTPRWQLNGLVRYQIPEPILDGGVSLQLDGATQTMSYIVLKEKVRLRVSISGQGPTVILVHGWKMSHRAWDRSLYALSKHFRVVAYDLRGMGESDKPDFGYTFEQYADDLFELIKTLEITDATLVGWSMGCSVALSYMQRHASGVSRLCLINGPVKLVNGDGFNYGLPPETLEHVLDNLATHWPECERGFVQKVFFHSYPEHVDWFTRIALQTPLHVALAIVAAQARLDQRPVIAALDVPVLAMYGRHDPYYPVTLGDWIASTATDGQALIFEESAHCPPVEETNRFVSALTDFVYQAPPGN